MTVYIWDNGLMGADNQIYFIDADIVDVASFSKFLGLAARSETTDAGYQGYAPTIVWRGELPYSALTLNGFVQLYCRDYANESWRDALPTSFWELLFTRLDYRSTFHLKEALAWPE